MKRISKSALVSILLVLALLSSVSSCANTDAPPAAADYLARGEKYLLGLDYEQAAEQFLKAIEARSTDPRGYTGAAQAYIALGDVDEAVEVLRDGLEALPDNEEIQNLAEAFMATEEEEDLSDAPDRDSQSDASAMKPTPMPATDASEPHIAEAAETPAPESTSEPIPDFDYPTNTYTYIQTLPDGYKIEQTLSIGSWIRASETQMLDSAWTAVGGKGEPPMADTFIDNIVSGAFRSDRSVIAYGTLSLRNLTEGFDITAEYPLSPLVTIRRKSNPFDETASLGMWSVAMDFSSERRVQAGNPGRAISTRPTLAQI